MMPEDEADLALQVRAGFAASTNKNCHSCVHRYDAASDAYPCSRCSKESHWEWDGWHPESWATLKARGQVPK